MILPFTQLDVFSDAGFLGNPLAVIHDADGLTTDQMKRIAVWTNLSETTFLLSPTDPQADYRVRIFSLDTELPFAGHPTLGTCQAWLEAGGKARAGGEPETVIQECDLGLITIRRDEGRLAFAAPPPIRSGPVAADDLAPVLTFLGLTSDEIEDAAWCDNGPGWIGVLLPSAADVLAITPPSSFDPPLEVGIIGPHPPGADAEYEVRAFFPAGGGTIFEDPVTGSLNAALGQWLFESGRVDGPYVAAQGTAIGRSGRVFVERDEGTVWVGGHSAATIRGTIDVGEHGD